MTTTIMGILFAIAGLFEIDYNIETIKSNLILYGGYFFTFAFSIVCFIISLVLCLKTYTISEYNILSPMKMKNAFDSSPKNYDFLKDIIEEIDYEINKNSGISSILWDKYTKAIAFLGSGIVLIIFFVIFTIIIKVGL